MEEKEAKDILQRKGYYVGRLWNIADVKKILECGDEEAYIVLKKVLNNGLLNEHIQDLIKWTGIKHLGLKTIDHEHEKEEN